MIHLRLADDSVHPLAFYLAMEEWAANSLPPAEYFFAWRVNPTVICGRHQDISAEVNLEYCRSNAIDVVRRKSGGGAVYADMQNLMFSYITAASEVQSVFAHYTMLVSEMLRSLGLDAAPTGRNDILVAGRKISGNAFYHLPDRAIVHGTMLYQTDFEALTHALTPSRAKLQAKGVKSVPARVTSLTEQGIDMDINRFHRFAVEYMTSSERIVSLDDIRRIQNIEQSYYDPAFFNGRHHSPMASTIIRKALIDGVGEVEAQIALTTDNRLDSISLGGDFFMLADPDSLICNHLIGAPFAENEIGSRLGDIDVSAAIPGLSGNQLLKLLFPQSLSNPTEITK